tara:strand:+ start:130 stop:294 length:165 start_codon:yes stop_codon:yes gene_type:complete
VLKSSNRGIKQSSGIWETRDAHLLYRYRLDGADVRRGICVHEREPAADEELLIS